MNAKTHEIIIGVIHLAKDFRARSDVSIYSLLKEAGYFDAYSEVSEDEIGKALTCYPNSVSDWIRYSEDKRSSSGWYFRQDGTGYEVGYFSPLQNDIDSVKYSDGIKACAAFIKREIEDVRNK